MAEKQPTPSIKMRYCDTWRKLFQKIAVDFDAVMRGIHRDISTCELISYSRCEYLFPDDVVDGKADAEQCPDSTIPGV